MKTQTILSKLIHVVLILAFLTMAFSCKSFFDADIDPPRLVLDDLPEKEPEIEFPKGILGTSAGFGWNSSEDISETAFCFGAEYQFRLSNNNNKGAGYLGGFANYHTEKADDYSLNSLKLGPKYTYYDRLTRNGEVDLTYSLKGHYETGSVENFGNKDDITGYGASASIGVNFNLSSKFSIGVETPVISYWDQTLKYDGGEVNRNQTSIAFNKNNPVMGYARWRF